MTPSSFASMKEQVHGIWDISVSDKIYQPSWLSLSSFPFAEDKWWVSTLKQVTVTCFYIFSSSAV
jgi:hypothetical protein